MRRNKNSIRPIIELLLTILIAVLVYNSYTLQNQLREREILISKMKIESSKRANKTEKLVKEIQTEVAFRQGPKKMSADEFIMYANNLANEIESLKDSIDFYKTYHAMSIKNSSDIFTVKKENNRINYSLTRKALNKDTVKSILENKNNIINKLEEENNKISNKLRMYQKAIDKYGINFKDITEDKNSISYYIVAPKVDSALLIYPVYKKKLKFNSKKNLWEIR